MKKVLFFIESLGGGGAEKVLATLVSHIDKEKFDVTVLTVVKTGVYVEEVEKHCRLLTLLPDDTELTNPLERIKYKLDYKFIYSAPARMVYQRYIHERYDVEVAFVEGFATKLIAASTNPTSKKICWLHSDMVQNPYADAYFRSLEEEKAAYGKYSSIVAVSKSVKETFEQKFGIKGTTCVIYNPVDSMDISQKAKTIQPEKKTDCLHLVSTGRLVKQKGYDRLIAALASVRNKDLTYHLWILGEGEDRGKLEGMISDNHLEEKITLLGFQNNPYPWVAASDVFICSSRAEGYSLAIAEAMILGKPIISVDCSGPNELLDYGKYGLLIPNEDECLEEVIYQLLMGKIDIQKLCRLSQERKCFFELTNAVNQVEMLLSDAKQVSCIFE